MTYHPLTKPQEQLLLACQHEENQGAALYSNLVHDESAQADLERLLLCCYLNTALKENQIHVYLTVDGVRRCKDILLSRQNLKKTLKTAAIMKKTRPSDFKL